MDIFLERTADMNKRREIICTLVLIVTALIWGCAFAAQSIGAGFVGPFTFLTARTWIAFFALLPVIAVREQVLIRMGDRVKKTAGQSKMLILGGAVCGFFLFTASASQQIGISFTTTAKAGFITALYVVLVPVLSFFFAPEREQEGVGMRHAGGHRSVSSVHGGKLYTVGRGQLDAVVRFSFQSADSVGQLFCKVRRSGKAGGSGVFVRGNLRRHMHAAL